MQITLNGKKKETESATVLDLLSSLNLKPDMVAVELNKALVHRQNFETTMLKNNDSLEIVTVVGGG